jgi:hypothetical protein
MILFSLYFLLFFDEGETVRFTLSSTLELEVVK